MFKASDFRSLIYASLAPTSLLSMSWMSWCLLGLSLNELGVFLKLILHQSYGKSTALFIKQVPSMDFK